MPETINIPLMRTVLEHIEKHPEQHDQGSWIEHTECGTTACFAGHTVLLAGGTLRRETNREITCRDREGYGRGVPAYAQELLGLDHNQAARMFYVANDLDDLWTMAQQITGGALKRSA